jgi:RNA-directed DNA polymerase
MTGTGSPGRSSPAGEAASFLERTAAHARAERSEPLAVATDIEAPGTEFHRGVGALLAVRDRLLLVHRSLTFLGFDIRRMRKPGTSKYYVYTKPSRKAIRSVKDKAKAKTYRSTLHSDLDELILSLDRSLAGWANYFRHGSSKATFSAVDYFAWGRLMRWIRAKYAGKTGLSMKELRRHFCDQGWRFAWNGVVLTGASSVAVTRYRYRGSIIPTPWTPAPAPAPAAADPGG